MGRSDIKDASQRFDVLTQEEGRMVVAQSLKATHGVGNDVRDVGDGVNVAIDKVDAVLDGAHHISFDSNTIVQFMARWREHEGRITTSSKGRERSGERCK
jgi:hypothetical protein